MGPFAKSSQDAIIEVVARQLVLLQHGLAAVP